MLVENAASAKKRVPHGIKENLRVNAAWKFVKKRSVFVENFVRTSS